MKSNRIILALTFVISMGIPSMASAQKSVKLSDGQIEDIVKRSYQYVAMYNVNQKLALDEEGMNTGGYNKGLKNTDLLDHTAEFIARPNNDTIYKLAMLEVMQFVFNHTTFDPKNELDREVLALYAPLGLFPEKNTNLKMWQKSMAENSKKFPSRSGTSK